MKIEKSCGAIVFRKDSEEIVYLILQHTAGHWSFPKGHVENDETEIETAQREVLEETGLHVAIDFRFRMSNTYTPYTNVLKEVIYFAAEATKSIVVLQSNEILSSLWLPLDEALQLLTFESDKDILIKADEYLKKNYSK
ncbi:bis(5'-nucleosyl)-tetraphosphatase [Rubeoparvulum massiliense]|uniref:bis(5'-nucleosyl)-tetraphosphatase n=1 Tax=Rubeoparvulum massiliense TaxID=1631346 RepID=UPI00065DE955|nr:bis(5'-nucleosyl)-tetraphosphatase [Rubeoparvulum massiliense]